MQQKPTSAKERGDTLIVGVVRTRARSLGLQERRMEAVKEY